MTKTKHHDEVCHDIRKSLNQISMNAELLRIVSEGQPAQAELAAIAEAVLASSLTCSELLKQLKG
ncbi:histidine kinase [Pseudoalteromonas fenneropenaei]|uniref:Histidine kinase n=1 Tax=Pseudoalteromonas fenneropenaei TaxID=1737459 RepID=A0ABV7CND1_9GAMM